MKSVELTESDIESIEKTGKSKPAKIKDVVFYHSIINCFLFFPFDNKLQAKL